MDNPPPAAAQSAPLLSRALAIAAELSSHYDDHGDLPEGVDRFFTDVRALEQRRKKKTKTDHMEQDNAAAASSSSSSTAAVAPGNLSGPKRRRAEDVVVVVSNNDNDASSLPPAPAPEVVVYRFIELPKLTMIRILHYLLFPELAALDSSCKAFHPVGLTQAAAQMRAQWGMTKQQAATVRRPTMAWSRWLVDVQWRERVVRAGGNGRLACGGGGWSQHALVVDGKGRVLSYGNFIHEPDSEDEEENTEMECPMLGHGQDQKSQQVPKVIAALKGKRVVQVSAGERHSLVLAEGGVVFSFGRGDLGQLGHGDAEEQHLPKLVEALKGKKVVQVSADGHHNLVLAEKNQPLPKLVEALKGKKVVQVAAGGAHCLVVTESGDVFSFGNGCRGQLGHGDEEQQSLPKLVEALKGKKIVQVSAGDMHSLVVTEGGDVFSFGKGTHGQLGHGDKKMQHLPKLVEALKGKKVVQVSAGHMHSLVLTKGSDVFSFGNGWAGMLGHGDKEEQHLPKLVEALKGKKVVEICAGCDQSLVLTKDDCVFALGLTFERPNPEWDQELAYDYENGGAEIEDYDVPRTVDTLHLLPHCILPPVEEGDEAAIAQQQQQQPQNERGRER